MHISQESRVQQEEADSRDQTYQKDDHQEQKNYIRHVFFLSAPATITEVYVSLSQICRLG